MLAAVTLTGCGHGMTADEMKKIAEAHDVCVDLGGTFKQWPTDFGTNWRCDFDEGDN